MLPNDHHENSNLKSNKQKVKQKNQTKTNKQTKKTKPKETTTKPHTSQEGQVAGISLQPSGKLSYVAVSK